MKPAPSRLLITFMNGSTHVENLESTRQAYGYAMTKLSLGNSRIARVELLTQASGSIRALWDRDWTPESQRAGLYCPD